jgi:hypothetical protein
MTTWIIWAAMLLVQNASFTWVSRARNSSSVAYHGVASIFSNGIWFISLMFAVDKIKDARASHSAWLLVATAVFYTIFTVIGSISAHHFLMTKVEKGKRKVG